MFTIYALVATLHSSLNQNYASGSGKYIQEIKA